jgi:hypothetical protein
VESSNKAIATSVVEIHQPSVSRITHTRASSTQPTRTFEAVPQSHRNRPPSPPSPHHLVPHNPVGQTRTYSQPPPRFSPLHSNQSIMVNSPLVPIQIPRNVINTVIDRSGSPHSAGSPYHLAKFLREPRRPSGNAGNGRRSSTGSATIASLAEHAVFLKSLKESNDKFLESSSNNESTAPFLEQLPMPINEERVKTQMRPTTKRAYSFYPRILSQPSIEGVESNVPREWRRASVGPIPSANGGEDRMDAENLLFSPSNNSTSSTRRLLDTSFQLQIEDGGNAELYGQGSNNSTWSSSASGNDSDNDTVRIDGFEDGDTEWEDENTVSWRSATIKENPYTF